MLGNKLKKFGTQLIAASILLSTGSIVITYNACSERKLVIASNNLPSNTDNPGPVPSTVEGNVPPGMISSVTVLGGTVTVNGNNLDNILSARIKGSTQEIPLTILEKTLNRLVVQAATALQLRVGGVYQLILSQASAQVVAPIQVVVSPGSCAAGQVLEGFNSDGTLKCVQPVAAINFNAPTRFDPPANTNFTTPAPFKLCIMINHYVGVGGACDLSRLGTGQWQFNCAGVTQTLTTIYNLNYGYAYNTANGGSSDGALYCYN